MPIHCSAPCKAILTYLPASECETIIKEVPFKYFNENTITSKKVFIEELGVVKKCGYALDQAEQISGAHYVAAPVFEQNTDNPIATI